MIIIKMLRKTDYSDKKQYKQHKHQQNKNNQKTKMGTKTIVWTFQATNRKISHEKIWICQRKGSLKRETESLLIAAQNNAIRTMSKQK